MDDKEMRFEDFLSDISPEFTDYATQIHASLLENGCVMKMQLAKSGHVVSYADPKSKKVVANLVSRKKGPQVRIYGDNVGKYMGFLATLPEGMLKAIDKASACKRMLDPTKCNSRCPMGYAFTIGDTLYQKCRYNCFMFEINAENSTPILTLLGNENRERAI